jgi:hypothetical protein
MKKALIIGCIVGVLFIGVGWFFSDKTIDPNTLFVPNCDVNNKTITFAITSTESATIIKKYSLKYKNNSLYILLKGTACTSNKNGIKKVSIKNKLKKLKNIYLTDGSTNKKIWSDPLTFQE